MGIDHMKYVVRQGQDVRISGVISEEIFPKYAGAFLNETITITPDFLAYEHSDGLNLVTVDFEYLFHIAKALKVRHIITYGEAIGQILGKLLNIALKVRHKLMQIFIGRTFSA